MYAKLICFDIMAKYVVAEPCAKIPVDWTKCVIYQNDTAEKLQCPTDSKRADNLAGYVSFANILPEFLLAKLLPVGFDLQRLDEGNGEDVRCEDEWFIKIYHYWHFLLPL